jgi:hypothetical protein
VPEGGQKAQEFLGCRKNRHLPVIFHLRAPGGIRKYRLTEDDATPDGGTKEAEVAAEAVAKKLWRQGGKRRW